VGEGDEPGTDGDGEEPPAGGEVDAAGLPDDDEDDADGVPVCAAEAGGDALCDCEAGDGEVFGVTLGDAVSGIAEGLVLAWPGAGPRATGRG
jgi:hypothetical protein